MIEGPQGFAFNPRGLLAIDMVTVHQRAECALTHVFVVVTAQQVIQHAFAQRTVAVVHALQFKGVEDRFQNRQPGRKDSPAIRLDAFKVDLVDFAQLEQFALEPSQAFGVDLTIAVTARFKGQTNGANGAGRADGFIPAQAVQGVLDAHDLQARGGVSLCITCRGDLAVAEVPLGITDATHLQAFTQQWLKALADDEFSTAAADVGHQALARRVGEGVRYAQINEACFFPSGNDFNGVPENLLGAHDELVAVTGFTQGVGAYNPHGAQGHTVDQLGKTFQAIEPALHGFFVEFAFFVDAGS